MDNINPASMNIIPGHISTSSAPRQEIQGEQPVLADDQVSVSGAASKKKQGEEVKYVKVKVLPQDPEVGPPRVIDFPKDKIGDKVAGERMVMVDSSGFPKATPDVDGNYIFDVGTPQFDQVDSYTCAYQTLDMLEKLLGSKIEWAFNSSRLTVVPHKQEGKNAYYSRYASSINFFWFQSPALNKTVQTSEAADITTHETSHASLDGMKPGYLGWDNETMSVHEAFADLGAMFFALQDETNILRGLLQNEGNFRNESLFSRLGEEFGKALHLEDTDPNNDSQIYLRSMINNFTYADPDTLPDDHNYDHLTGEPHNFSRLLSGSVYDILEKVYAKNLPKDGATDKKACLCALTSARDTVAKLFVKSFNFAPENACKYRDVALGMIKVDRMENQGANEDILKQEFIERGIITQQDVDNLNAQSIPQITVRKRLSTPEDVQKFLEKHGDSLGIPDGLTLNLRSITTNDKGERFVNMGFSEEMELKGKEFGKYDGYYADVSGGLTLAFDKGGKLIDFNFDSITDGKKEDVKAGVASCIRQDLVKEAGVNDIFKTDNDIYKGEVVQTTAGKKKIVRIPIVS